MIISVIVGADGQSVQLVLDKVIQSSFRESQLPGVRNREGKPLLHEVACYTMN